MKKYWNIVSRPFVRLIFNSSKFNFAIISDVLFFNHYGKTTPYWGHSNVT